MIEVFVQQTVIAPETQPQRSAIRTVLVVDDSRLQRRILSAMLKRWGFEVTEASTGAEALELSKKNAPRVHI